MTARFKTARECPYVGLMPFAKEDAEYFFGREKETEMLRLNLMASQSTLLYGASGVGKSSVINAGLMPALDRRDDVVVATFREWSDEPAAAIKAAIDAAAKDKMKDYKAKVRASLAETLEYVAESLANNIEDPDELIQRPGRVIVILDQVDEYIINYPLTSETEHSLAQAFRTPHPSVSVMVSIREDWLARLDRFLGIFPTLLDNIIRLEPLSVQGAEAAINRPVAQYATKYKNAGPIRVEEGLTHALIEQVRRTDFAAGSIDSISLLSSRYIQARVDTAFLQIVLMRLWNVEEVKGSKSLRLTTLKQLGDASHILDEHLASVFDRLSAEQQDQAVEMFDRLVTPSETKIAQSAEDLAVYLNSDTAQLASILDTLAAPDARVLRSFAPRDRPESKRYELYHDLLAKPVRGWLVGRRLEAQVDEYLSQRPAGEAEANRRIITQLPAIGPATAEKLVQTTCLTRETIDDAASALLQVGIVRAVGTDDPKYLFQPASGYRHELFRAPYAELLSRKESLKILWRLVTGTVLAGCVALALALLHPLQLLGERTLGELADATVVLSASALFGAFGRNLWRWQRDTVKGFTSEEFRDKLAVSIVIGVSLTLFISMFLFFGAAYLTGHSAWLRGSGTLWAAGCCAFMGSIYAGEDFSGGIKPSRRRPGATEEEEKKEDAEDDD